MKLKVNSTEWPYKAIQAKYFYKKETVALYFPAGVLQHPIYDAHVPMYLSLGSMGRLIGSSAVGAVEEHTGTPPLLMYKPNGSL